MFFILPVLVGTLIGICRGGNLWVVTRLKLRKIWILPVAYFIQYISIYYANGYYYELLEVISYVTLIGFCVLNVKIEGIKFIMVGIISNFIVMVFNHLRMPAYIPAVYKIDPKAVSSLELGEIDKSVAMTSHTHLNFLGDIFTFSLGRGSLISIGDILFGIGIAIVIQYAMCLERTTMENVITS